LALAGGRADILIGKADGSFSIDVAREVVARISALLKAGRVRSASVTVR
jgi:hypothetical protein